MIEMVCYSGLNSFAPKIFTSGAFPAEAETLTRGQIRGESTNRPGWGFCFGATATQYGIFGEKPLIHVGSHSSNLLSQIGDDHSPCSWKVPTNGCFYKQSLIRLKKTVQTSSLECELLVQKFESSQQTNRNLKSASNTT